MSEKRTMSLAVLSPSEAEFMNEISDAGIEHIAVLHRGALKLSRKPDTLRLALIELEKNQTGPGCEEALKITFGGSKRNSQKMLMISIVAVLVEKAKRKGD